MMIAILKLYKFIFVRKCFFKIHKLIYRIGLNGMGILNYENNYFSGEDFFLKKYLKNRRNAIIFDVGGNEGIYSKKIMEIEPSSKVYSFEPHPINYSKLKQIAVQYSFNAFNVAVSDKNCEIKLFDYADPKKDGSPHASIYKNVIEKIHKKESKQYNIRAVKLDEFAQELGLAEIDLLKIDTEGNELNVLKGFMEFIESSKVKIIHFEFNEMNVISKVFLNDIQEFIGKNYTFFRMLPDGLVPIYESRPVYSEIFAFQNIVAILNSEKTVF